METKLFWRSLVAITLMSLMMSGYGLVYAFTSIYLLRAAWGGPVVSALYFAIIGGSGIISGLLISMRGLPWSERISGLGAVTAGSLSLALFREVHNAYALCCVAVSLGVSTSVFQATVTPLLNVITPATRLRLVFALRYQGSNCALAVGVGLAGMLVDRRGIGVINDLFVGAAMLHLPLMLLLAYSGFWKSAHNLDLPESDAESSLEMGRGSGLLHALRPLLLFEFAVDVLVFPHLETTVPLYITEIARGPATFVSVTVIANLVGVVGLQVPMLRFLNGREFQAGLRCSVILWVMSYLTMLIFSAAGQERELLPYVLYGVLLSAGECAYSASLTPYLISNVSSSNLTRATALTNSFSSAGSLVAPPLGVLLVSSGSGLTVWGFFVFSVMVLAGSTVARLSGR